MRSTSNPRSASSSQPSTSIDSRSMEDTRAGVRVDLVTDFLMRFDKGGIRFDHDRSPARLMKSLDIERNSGIPPPTSTMTPLRLKSEKRFTRSTLWLNEIGNKASDTCGGVLLVKCAGLFPRLRHLGKLQQGAILHQDGKAQQNVHET